jgi:hypothetical protein
MADPVKLSMWLPAVSALLGALIGALASVATIWIQARIGDRRARAKLVYDSASADFNRRIALLDKAEKPYDVLPLVVYLHYHERLLSLIERDAMTPGNLEKVEEENERLVQKIIELNSATVARDRERAMSRASSSVVVKPQE